MASAASSRAELRDAPRGTDTQNGSPENARRSSSGACSGLELSADQVGPGRPPVTTEVEGLYLTGASTVYGHGIAGVLSGGVGTASAALGRDLLAEVKDGKVFGDPTLLTAGGPDWDPRLASRGSFGG